MNPRLKTKIGARIRAARVNAGYSQDRFAEAAGTTRRHLIRIERGDHVPRVDLMQRISELTGEPIERLSGDDDEEEAAQVTVTFTGSANVVADLMARLKVPVPVG